MDTIRIGIFGLGRGGGFNDNIMSNNGKIVAMCDRDKNKYDEAL